MEYLIIHDLHGIYNLFNADLIEDIRITPERNGNGIVIEIKRKGHFRYAKFYASDTDKISASTLTELTNKLK